VLKSEVLIVELGAVDRLSTSSIALREITTLNHELLDDSVKDRAFVREKFSGFSFAFLAGAEGSEVLCCFGDHIVVQLEGNSTFRLAAN
jgi:hypothetical protein